MWLRHERALARAIAAEIGAPADDAASAALAHFALESVDLARGKTDPAGTIEAVFALLENGWSSSR